MSEVKIHSAHDMYKYFVQTHPGTDVTYSLYKHVISQFNKKMADRILDGKEIVLGKNMGKLRISKVNRNYQKKVVDFGATNKLREQGIDRVVFFTNNTYYKWTWEKKSSKAVNKSAYSFKPSAGAHGLRRRLARLLNENEFAHLNFN